MPDLRFTIELDESFDEVTDDLIKALNRGLARALQSTARLWLKGMRRTVPVDRGLLKRTLRVEAVPRDGRILVFAQWYGAPVNARTRFIQRGFEKERASIIRAAQAAIIEELRAGGFQ